MGLTLYQPSKLASKCRNILISSSTAINKFPFLGDVPVLGSLFKSENFRNNRSDLVIFVTPVVQDPAATVNQQRIEKAKDLSDRFQNFLGKKGIVD